MQWLRDGLGVIRKSEEVEALAKSVPDNGGVYFVPAFVGLGAPHWDSYARGSIFGITRGTTAGHIARAAVESIAYQVADLLDAMRRDSGDAVKELRVDGGAAANDSLMQFQADILGVPVVRPAVTETTAMGAAYLAGLAVGFWPSGLDALAAGKSRRFEPADAAIASAIPARPLERSHLSFQSVGSIVAPASRPVVAAASCRRTAGRQTEPQGSYQNTAPLRDRRQRESNRVSVALSLYRPAPAPETEERIPFPPIFDIAP